MQLVSVWMRVASCIRIVFFALQKRPSSCECSLESCVLVEFEAVFICLRTPPLWRLRQPKNQTLAFSVLGWSKPARLWLGRRKSWSMLSWSISRWWFQLDFLFSALFGEDEPILTHIFQMGWNHQLDFLGHGSWTRKKSPVACLENFVGTLEPYWDWIYEALIF